MTKEKSCGTAQHSLEPTAPIGAPLYRGLFAVLVDLSRVAALPTRRCASAFPLGGDNNSGHQIKHGVIAMSFLKKIFVSKQDDELDTSKALKYLGRGDYEEALCRANLIIEDNPEVGMSWRFKAQCLEEMKRYEEAIEAYEICIAKGGPGTEEAPVWLAYYKHIVPATYSIHPGLTSTLHPI